jgi:hypothetical protein
MIESSGRRPKGESEIYYSFPRRYPGVMIIYKRKAFGLEVSIILVKWR